MDGAMVAHTVVALVALGMGLAFISADRKSPTSRALAATYAYVGISIYLNLVWTNTHAELPAWTAWFALPEAAATVAIRERAFLFMIRASLSTDLYSYCSVRQAPDCCRS